jgi:nitrate/nitrite transporter NarK
MTPSGAQGEGESTAGRFGKHVLAVFVLLIALWIIVQVFVHIVAFLFFPILAIVAILALIWAIRVLF